MLEIYSLLNPKIANYNGTGGIPNITPEDVAACLARIKIMGPSLLVRTLAGDESCRRPLAQAFSQHVANLAGRKHWKTDQNFSAYFDGFCIAVLNCYLPITCKRCRGRRFIMRYHTVKTACPACAGAGNKEATPRDLALISGIPFAAWVETWQDRYVAARDILVEWEQEADAATKRVFWAG